MCVLIKCTNGACSARTSVCAKKAPNGVSMVVCSFCRAKLRLMVNAGWDLPIVLMGPDRVEDARKLANMLESRWESSQDGRMIRAVPGKMAPTVHLNLPDLRWFTPKATMDEALGVNQLPGDAWVSMKEAVRQGLRGLHQEPEGAISKPNMPPKFRVRKIAEQIRQATASFVRLEAMVEEAQDGLRAKFSEEPGPVVATRSRCKLPEATEHVGGTVINPPYGNARFEVGVDFGRAFPNGSFKRLETAHKKWEILQAAASGDMDRASDLFDRLVP